MKTARSCSFHKGQDAQAVAGWVAARIPGCERGFGPCAALSVSEGGKILGAVVFHNYSPESDVMELSAAAECSRWITRPVLRAVHDYVFAQAGCQMSVMRTSEKNTQARRVVAGCGYQPFVIPRLRGRGEAEVIWTLTDDDWRKSKIYEVRHGQA